MHAQGLEAVRVQLPNNERVWIIVVVVRVFGRYMIVRSLDP